MATSPVIPRFLLTKLSWKAAISPSAARPLAQPCTKPILHRCLSSPARAWQSEGPPHSPVRSRRHEHSTARPEFPRRELARGFSTTQSFHRDHHFDTLKFVQRLKHEGFSEEQSKAMMLVLSDVIEESIQNLTRTMVLREGILPLPNDPRAIITLTDSLTDADRSTYTQKVDFTKLRSELLALDSSDTSVTLASHERLSNDLAKLNSRLRDEVNRAQASVRLDLNLEKGRIREEAKGQELKIKETETRIEQEVAGLRERVEGVKFSTLQWLMYVKTSVRHVPTLSLLANHASKGCLHRYSCNNFGCLALVNVRYSDSLQNVKTIYALPLLVHNSSLSHQRHPLYLLLLLLEQELWFV